MRNLGGLGGWNFLVSGSVKVGHLGVLVVIELFETIELMYDLTACTTQSTEACMVIG